jgi:phytoene desaturase
LRLAPDDADAFFAFMARAAKWYRMSAESVIYGPPLDWKGMKGSKFDPISFFRMRPFESLERFIDRTFRDERIRRVARLIALYTGCSPHRAPAIFSLIAFLEFGLGRWYIDGGLYRIVELLVARYRELGGEYRPSTTIERVEFEGGRGRAAITDRGDSIEGDAFIVNADVALAAKTFLRDAPGASRLSARLGNLRRSTSAFVLMIGTRADCTRLIHHNLLFSTDEWREWKEVFEAGVPPSEPTIYLNNPSYTDRGLAPAGGSALFAMVNVPADDRMKWEWTERANEYQELVLRRIETLVPALRGNIDVIRRRTPPEFRQRTFADRGSIYGRAPDSLRAMMMRPRNEEKGFEGIYFAGGTTHPGAGIPLAALSGKLVARRLLEGGLG